MRENRCASQLTGYRNRIQHEGRDSLTGQNAALAEQSAAATASVAEQAAGLAQALAVFKL